MLITAIWLVVDFVNYNNLVVAAVAFWLLLLLFGCCFL